MNFLKSFFSSIRKPFKTETVYALVGPSGTGKSYKAKFIAGQHKLQAIIDDGLLIQQDKIIAGKSAKSEQTFLGAVRRALFDDNAHRDAIIKNIQRHHIKRILILGTSEKMARKIATRLQLPQPEKIIHIEDISSKEEIQMARKSRQIEGKHVIPVAANEVKKLDSKIFAAGIRFRFHRFNPFHVFVKESKVIEKSIVEPVFSKQERSDISEAALIHYAADAIAKAEAQSIAKKMRVTESERGYKLTITLSLAFQKTNVPFVKRIENLQKKIIDTIESASGIFIEEANIIVDKMLPITA